MCNNEMSELLSLRTWRETPKEAVSGAKCQYLSEKLLRNLKSIESWIDNVMKEAYCPRDQITLYFDSNVTQPGQFYLTARKESNLELLCVACMCSACLCRCLWVFHRPLWLKTCTIGSPSGPGPYWKRDCDSQWGFPGSNVFIYISARLTSILFESPLNSKTNTPHCT